MASTFPQLLKALSDPSRFVRREAVKVFDEHEEKDGKEVRKFTRAKLERIARECNARWAREQPCPLSLGHTLPGVQEEAKQPPLVGYAKDFRVARDPVLKRHVILADFYIRKAMHGRAEGYPRVSVELWADDDFFDPIALLRRTPQRDVGQWSYGLATAARQPLRTGKWHYAQSARGRRVIRYSMDAPLEGGMNDDDMVMDDAPPGGMGDMPGEPGADAPPEPSHEEKAEQFMRHCFSHPHAKYMAEHYSMPGEPEMGDEPGGEAPMPEPAPDAPPDADADPAQYSAFPGAGQAMPGMVGQDEEPQRHAKGPSAEALARSRAEVAVLVGEGYLLDEKREVQRFARIGPERSAERSAYIRQYHRPAPLAKPAQAGPVKTAAPKQAVKARPMSEMTEAEAAKVMQYMKHCRSKGRSVTFEQAACSKQFGFVPE